MSTCRSRLNTCLWREGTTLPTGDGTYLVVMDGVVLKTNYTVKYGWNTIRAYDGTYHIEHRFDNKDVTYWTPWDEFKRSFSENTFLVYCEGDNDNEG